MLAKRGNSIIEEILKNRQALQKVCQVFEYSKHVT